MDKHSFQAETQQLLDIVIHSLYTDREIFVRELISNAADACERLRFLQSSSAQIVLEPETPLAIRIETNEPAGTLTITDTGIGMTQAELIEHLGTIAHSGTRAFLRQLAESNQASHQLIGRFGVGFYSAFMAARRVTVESRSCQPDAPGHRWISEGAAGYEVEPAPDLPRGTRITLELKDDAKDFARPATIEAVVKKYSNFVQFPIELNGRRLNTISAIWARPRHEVKDEEYAEFYRFIGRDTADPLMRLHFTADAPLSLQSLLFIPATNLEAFGLVRTECEIHLYCRKVLIDARPQGLLPEWLRFVRGVVDSEDLPLNVSRERMQDSSLILKLNRALTNRFLKFLDEQSTSAPDTYDKFYEQYQRYLKEGVLSDFLHTEALGKLLRFESTGLDFGKRTSLADYIKRMPTDQSEIYFLLDPQREAAQQNPYLEVFRALKWEVLLLREPMEEFVLERISRFEGKPITAAEKAKTTLPQQESSPDELAAADATALADWLKSSLKDAIHEVRVSQRLVDSPALILEPDQHLTTTMRRTLRLMRQEEGPAPTAPDLEINPRHGMIRRLESLRHQHPELAAKVAEQIVDNARLAAGLLEDPRPMIKRLNELITTWMTETPSDPTPPTPPAASTA